MVGISFLELENKRRKEVNDGLFVIAAERLV